MPSPFFPKNHTKQQLNHRQKTLIAGQATRPHIHQSTLSTKPQWTPTSLHCSSGAENEPYHALANNLYSDMQHRHRKRSVQLY